jgi:site-specific DNA-cytosine methylase
MQAVVRVLELFCGIGGCAAALAGRVRVTAAVDVSRAALEVYARNFPAHPAAARTLESIGAADLRRWRAELWWLSPPCQPFTRRGHGRDDDDPRSAGLLALIPLLAAERPPFVALENVPGFAVSRTRARLIGALDGAGYRVWEGELCPSALGVPNRRRRWFLVASREGDPAPPPPTADPSRLADHLDAEPAPELAVDPDLLRRYHGALDLVSATDPAAVTACFTAAYGRSPVRSGSYLVEGGSIEGGLVEQGLVEQGRASWSGAGLGLVPGGRARRFSPAEVLRLLGFPPDFTLPPGLPRATGWRLAGNSLSLPTVRAALAGVPGLAPT